VKSGKGVSKRAVSGAGAESTTFRPTSTSLTPIDLYHSVAETSTEGASIIQWVRSGIYTELRLR